MLPMLLKQNIYERNIAVLRSCVKDGYIKEADVHEINEMTLLIYQGMFMRIYNSQIDYTIDEAVEKTIKFIKQTLKSYTDTLII